MNSDMKNNPYKVGSRYRCKTGEWCTVVEYIGAKKVGVVFDNYSDIYWTRNEYLKSGDFINPLSKNPDIRGRMFMGQRFYSKSFGVCFVKEFLKDDKVKVEFNDSTEIIADRNSVFLKRIKNPNKPAVHGVGYIGQGKYDSHNVAYNIWTGMLSRCYSDHIKFRTYSESRVSDSWLCFQNFAKDYNEMLSNCKFERPQLDKDLIPSLDGKGRGSLYSKENCCLLPHQLNTALQLDCQYGKLSSTPVGVSIWENRYKAQMQMYGKNKYLGVFNNLETAVKTYNKAKSAYILELTYIYKDKLPSKVYEALIIKTKEILNAQHNK